MLLYIVPLIIFMFSQIKFEAQRGSSHSSSCDIALDNIVISEGPCPCEFPTLIPKETTQINVQKPTNFLVSLFFVHSLHCGL